MCRDCLVHVIVLNESHLCLILSSYFDYYHYDRIHFGLGKDSPFERQVQYRPAKSAKVIELPGSMDSITATNGKRPLRQRFYRLLSDLLRPAVFSSFRVLLCMVNTQIF